MDATQAEWIRQGEEADALHLAQQRASKGGPPITKKKNKKDKRENKKSSSKSKSRSESQSTSTSKSKSSTSNSTAQSAPEMEKKSGFLEIREGMLVGCKLNG